MMKKKHIRVVKYTIFVYEENALDLENMLSDVLRKSSIIDFVCSGEKWS